MTKGKYSSTERWTLLATILGSSMVFIDGTALNVAMPTIQEELHLTGAQLLWVVNAYALFLSALLLIGGALGDQFGRNRIFGIGLLIFVVSSFICGISTSSMQLIIARAFQGVGGALLTPGSLSIITARFSADKVGGAIGLWSTFSALTAIVGPVLGGWLSGLGLWRVIFFINIPFSILVFWAIFRRVPESKNKDIVRLDFTGALLITLGLAGITYGFIESSNRGFGDVRIILSLAIGGCASIAFLYSQYRGRYPMMPLKLFSSINFTVTNIATLLIYGAMGATLFFLPLNLVQIQGYSEAQTGFSALPTIILIVLLSTISGRLSDRFGARLFLSLGPLVTGFGFLFFGLQGLTTGPSAYWHSFFIPTVLLGIGMGLTVAPLTTTVMSSVSKNNSGIASGVNNTVSRMSGVLSIALMGAMAIYFFRLHLFTGISGLDLPEEVLESLEKEAINLGSTAISANTPEELVTEVSMAIKHAFIHSFNRVSFISAVAAWISALLCFILLKPGGNQ